jgi:hypothetical protein
MPFVRFAGGKVSFFERLQKYNNLNKCYNGSRERKVAVAQAEVVVPAEVEVLERGQQEHARSAMVQVLIQQDHLLADME